MGVIRPARRPLIAVTEPDIHKGGNLSWAAIRLALWRAGGQALRCTPSHPHLDQPVHGLILAGGDDILPERYGGENHLGPYDPPRDEMEMAWFAKADRHHLPVLGICRGAQLMNVCRGGTLYADITLVHEEAKYPVTLWGKIINRKWIDLVRESQLHKVLRASPCLVNSLHHQCVAELGKGLAVVAKERKGIVQAIEDPEHPQFMLGVQWHPEYMLAVRRQQRIFRALVRAARKTQPA